MLRVVSEECFHEFIPTYEIDLDEQVNHLQNMEEMVRKGIQQAQTDLQKDASGSFSIWAKTEGSHILIPYEENDNANKKQADVKSNITTEAKAETKKVAVGSESKPIRS